MKRSEAIKKLLPMVVSPNEVILKEYYDGEVYQDRANRLLKFIENELKMLPPAVENAEDMFFICDKYTWEAEDEKK